MAAARPRPPDGVKFAILPKHEQGVFMSRYVWLSIFMAALAAGCAPETPGRVAVRGEGGYAAGDYAQALAG